MVRGEAGLRQNEGRQLSPENQRPSYGREYEPNLKRIVKFCLYATAQKIQILKAPTKEKDYRDHRSFTI
jgi:hypothetical protein